MRLADAGRVGAEMLARQAYFRLPEPTALRLRARISGLRGPGSPPARTSIEALAGHLERYARPQAGLLMVHASSDALHVEDDAGGVLPSARAALALLGVLKRLVGPEGTLCMPTHPLYKREPGYLYDKSELVFPYSVRRTASSVGILTELFRRDDGTLRSAHPLSSLAAQGPKAEALIEGNLNDREPLPHGVDSGYHRFCQQGGTVLGIGIPLVHFLTVGHVSEEVMDDGWPVRDFFYRRRFQVDDGSGGKREVVVRERRPEFVRAFSMGQLRRDLLREGILREQAPSGLRVEVLDARALLEYMTRRQERGPYPYYGSGLAGWGRPPRAVARGRGVA